MPFTACIIFKTPPTIYFAHGVLNIMHTVNYKTSRPHALSQANRQQQKDATSSA